MIESNSNGRTRHGRAFHRRGFSLVELLIVIAIISILAGLLFPAIASVLENNRETNTMASMQQIQSALALYKLDNKRYPDVLFAYAPSGAYDSTNPCMSMATASSSACAQYQVGLFPGYISDWHVFTCRNNTLDDPTLRTTVNVFTPNANALTSSSSCTLQTTQQQTFFKLDAYDISPQIGGVNQVKDPTADNYVVRYQTSWTDYTPSQQNKCSSNYNASPPSTSTYTSVCFPSGTCASGNYSDPDYQRQLRWTTPPPNTYVTSTTDHIKNANRVMVLYLDGTVKKVSLLDGWQNGITDGSTEMNTTTSADYTNLEKSYNDGQSDIGGVPIDSTGTDSNVYASKAVFWRTLAGRGEISSP